MEFDIARPLPGRARLVFHILPDSELNLNMYEHWKRMPK